MQFSLIGFHGFFCICLLCACETPSSMPAAPHPLDPEVVARVVESAIKERDKRGTIVTSKTNVEVEMESPCKQKGRDSECYLVKITQPIPPRSLADSRIAEVRLTKDNEQADSVVVY